MIPIRVAAGRLLVATGDVGVDVAAMAAATGAREVECVAVTPTGLRRLRAALTLTWGRNAPRRPTRADPYQSTGRR